MTKIFLRAGVTKATVALVLCGAATVQAQVPKPLVSFKSLADFANCQRYSYADDVCLVALEKFAQSHPKEAMQAGKIARLNYNSAVALRFFEVASKQNAKGFCQDADVQLATVSGLGLPGDYPDARRATTLFADRCFAEHVAAVVKELGGETGDSYLKRNTCPILERRQQAPAACQPVAANNQPEAQPPAVDKLPTLDKSQITLGSVKVYRGPEGERVTMAPIQGADLYLIRFDGVNSPWNGKVLLHQRADRGNDAADFWTTVDAQRWNSVARRGGMTVYVPGYKVQNGFNVSYADKLSQEADATALLNAYQP